MHIKRTVLYGVLFGLLCTTENVTSIILTTTLLTGFMGGFLIGRMSLASFLSLLAANGTSLPTLPTINLIPQELLALIPREEVVASTMPPTTSTSRAPVYPQADSSSVITLKIKPQQPKPFTITPVNVPVSLDNKIRDRFIKQLALMDPLNCLPKLFCEVSSDPYGAASSIPHGTITAVRPAEELAITKEELVAYENHLIMEKTTTTTTTQKPVEAADTNDDVDEQNDSGSNESNHSYSEEESDEEDDSFERYKKEQEYKLEMQAYEEMLDEIEDPGTYLYILRDEKHRKKQRQQYKTQQYMMSENRVRKDSMLDKIAKANIDPPLILNRRMGDDPPLPPLDYMYPMMPTTEPPMENMFADDPFFDDFGSKSRRLSRGLKGKSGKESRRSSRTNPNAKINGNIKEEDLMKKFRVAFIVAEKYRSPNVCAVTFPTCPYQTKTIMSVVNRLESGLLPFGKNSKPKEQKQNKLDNIDHFRNTLLAIESLNKATLRSQFRGEPLNIDKMTEDAASPTTQLESNTSQQIVNEFQQVVTKIGSVPLKEKKRKKKPNSNDRRKYDVVHYYKMALFGLKPKQRIKTDKGSRKKFESVRNQDDEALVRKNKWERVPSFNQTYKDMFQSTTPKPRRRLRPMPMVVSKIFEKSLTKPSTTKKPVKEFKIEGEDDEEDAKESEEAIDALISQGKSSRSPIL